MREAGRFLRRAGPASNGHVERLPLEDTALDPVQIGTPTQQVVRPGDVVRLDRVEEVVLHPVAPRYASQPMINAGAAVAASA